MPDPRDGGAKPAARCGASLVEVMFAVAILVVLALTGASMIYMSQNRLTLQKQRRVATEIANARIEELRAQPFSSLIPLSGSSVFLKATNSTFTRHSSDPQEKITVGGLGFPIVTRASWGAGGADAPTNSLVVTADVTYDTRTGDHITLATVHAE